MKILDQIPLETSPHALTLMRIAYQIAQLSPDPSTQNGAIIVENNQIVASGFNRFPEGIDPSIWHDRELKYEWVIHAEMDALMSYEYDDSTMYCPFASCHQFAKHLLLTNTQPGLHGDRMRATAKWPMDEVFKALTKLNELGMVTKVVGSLGVTVRHGGEVCNF